eukprot:m.149528 g.149528  ORF g.149528 m.149528 type:complete len:58 (+) comp30663_c0_seq1:964-1137(+)
MTVDVVQVSMCTPIVQVLMCTPIPPTPTPTKKTPNKQNIPQHLMLYFSLCLVRIGRY